MAQLRPELDEDAFIDRVRRQRLLGYRLLTARAPRGPVVGVAGFVPLFATGLAYVALFGAIWVLFVYRGEPHVDTLATLRARRQGSA